MKDSHKRAFSLAALLAAALFLFPALPAGAQSGPEATAEPAAPTLTFIGHASMKIKTAEGAVIYIDPYYEGDYSEKADLILVTHEHSDHNQIKLCKQNEGCVVLRVKQTINKDLTYNTFEYSGVKIEPVPAENKNHSIKSSTGFVLSFDGIVLYHAGDTSLIPQMADLAARNIDYAFFPIDGKYNMDATEAMECAAMVGAKHNTPIHFFSASPEDFKPENVLYIAYGETVALAPAEDLDEANVN